MKDWAPEQHYNLSASGGTKSVKYYVSGDMLNKGGLFKSNALKYNQYQLRSNLDIQLIKDLKVEANLYGRFENREEPGVNNGFINKALTRNIPVLVGYYPNGLPGFGGENGTNPAIMSSNKSGFSNTNKKILRAKFLFELDMDWVTKGLQLKGYSALDFNLADHKTFHDTWTVYHYNKASKEYIPQSGFNFETGDFLELRESYNSSQEKFLNIQLNYNRSFGDHTFQGFVAYEQLEGDSKTFYAYKKGLLSNQLVELFTVRSLIFVLPED